MSLFSLSEVSATFSTPYAWPATNPVVLSGVSFPELIAAPIICPKSNGQIRCLIRFELCVYTLSTVRDEFVPQISFSFLDCTLLVLPIVDGDSLWSSTSQVHDPCNTTTLVTLKTWTTDLTRLNLLLGNHRLMLRMCRAVWPWLSLVTPPISLQGLCNGQKQVFHQFHRGSCRRWSLIPIVSRVGEQRTSF